MNMATYYIESSIKDVEKRLGSLWKKSGVVLSNATKRAVTTGKKVIKQETVKRYNMLARDVEEVLSVVKNKEDHHGISYKLVYKDTHRNLMTFSTGKRINVVTPGKPFKLGKGGKRDPDYVKANVLKATGSIPLNGPVKPFVVQTEKRIALFQRENTNPRSEIRGVGAPAIPQVVKNKEVMERFQKETSEMLENRIEHEIDWILKGK